MSATAPNVTFPRRPEVTERSPFVAQAVPVLSFYATKVQFVPAIQCRPLKGEVVMKLHGGGPEGSAMSRPRR